MLGDGNASVCGCGWVLPSAVVVVVVVCSLQPPFFLFLFAYHFEFCRSSCFPPSCAFTSLLSSLLLFDFIVDMFCFRWWTFSSSSLPRACPLHSSFRFFSYSILRPDFLCQDVGRAIPPPSLTTEAPAKGFFV